MSFAVSDRWRTHASYRPKLRPRSWSLFSPKFVEATNSIVIQIIIEIVIPEIGFVIVIRQPYRRRFFYVFGGTDDQNPG